MKRLGQLLLFIFLCLPLAVQAADQRAKPGDMAPPIAATDHTGSMQSLESLSGENGLVLAFIRSVEWCPYCQKQVRNLNARQSDFNALGYNVAALSYDLSETANSFSQKNDLSLPLLSDPRSDIIDAFGLLNTDHPKGTKFYGIAHPAIYILSPEGEITGHFAEDNYKLRPDFENVLASLKPEEPAADPDPITEVPDIEPAIETAPAE